VVERQRTVEEMTAATTPLAAFAGANVLVTGDTGFKGSWLCAWLLELGANVTGLALPAEPRSHFVQLGLAHRLKHHDCDLRGAQSVRTIIADTRPEIVLHLGAQSLVRPSYADPVGTFATNVMGTVHVLDAVRAVDSVRAAVIVTSDKCYENREWVHGYRENDPMGGHDPYSASKGAAELVTSSFRRCYFGDAGAPGIASARAGNVVGGGDWAQDRLIPDCARTLLEGKPLLLRNPLAVRPWQHVLEPLYGYLVLAAKLLEAPERFSDAYNFGPADAATVTVEGIALAFQQRLGSGSIVADRDGAHPHEAHTLRLSCEKSRVELGVAPLLTTHETIDWTAQWYGAFRTAPEAAAQLTLKQIREYQQRQADRSQIR
jgi:CDP-glucose 4,6-dehydratase